jgi:hypothetical protein
MLAALAPVKLKRGTDRACERQVPLPWFGIAMREMAMGFMSLVEGVKLFRLSSPRDMTVEAVESILTLFIDALIRLARLRASRPRPA